jgi:hypothetical protein
VMGTLSIQPLHSKRSLKHTYGQSQTSAMHSAEGAMQQRHNGVTGYHRVLSWVTAEVVVTEAAEPHTGGTGREKLYHMGRDG